MDGLDGLVCETATAQTYNVQSGVDDRMTAAYYDSELEQATADALAKLEPTIMVFLAIVAGFIVISIYMAMFSMYAAM